MLHPKAIIEQALVTRKVIAHAVSQQFFGCFLNHENVFEWWLTNGMAVFFSALYFRKLLGNDEYKYMIYQDMKEVCAYERDHGPITLDMNSIITFNQESLSKTQLSFRHHMLGSSAFFKMVEKKAHLVMRLIDDHLGRDLMLQLVSKFLNQAQNASNELKSFTANCRAPFILNLEIFTMAISSLTNKDINGILDLWVYRPGAARFNCSFTFNRKKTTLELEVKQDPAAANQKGYRKYVGPLTIIVQEIDGSFTHTVNIEDNITSKFEILCHSKGKKNKKKKIPLITGEEVDIDTSQMDSDSPILWIR